MARPDRRRAGVVLGLPAPRQPVARTSARRGRDVAADRGARRATASSDLTEALDAFADRVDQEPESLPLELRPRLRRPGPAGRRRLAGRPGARARRPLDARRRRDGVARRAAAGRLRPPAGRHLAAVPARPGAAPRRGVQRGDRARARGAGRRPGRRARCGRPADLEHWAAFQNGFREVAGDGARGRRRASAAGPRATVTFLSGDVHHSYVAEARPARRRGRRASRILQAVCSPIRNPLPRPMRGSRRPRCRYGVAAPLGACRRPVGEGARPAVPLEAVRGAVVRQQPGHPRGDRPRGST